VWYDNCHNSSLSQLFTSGSRTRVWGQIVSTECEPIMGVCRQSPQWGPGAEPLVRGSGGWSLLKLNACLHYHNLRNPPVCPKIRTIGGMRTLPISPPKGGSKSDFINKIQCKSNKVCNKVSLCENSSSKVVV